MIATSREISRPLYARSFPGDDMAGAKLTFTVRQLTLILIMAKQLYILKIVFVQYWCTLLLYIILAQFLIITITFPRSIVSTNWIWLSIAERGSSMETRGCVRSREV